ncbi:hypothetical protein [Alkalicoccobacillus murimartini]|uniref:Competence protein ComGC n=1 Tax=Alkalicoccobacillus murimartini TaxID=171685 RepID=A0ABT9YKE3_9BACI|nr:hypothetical protein [Alkalicoccobacillus murimartini]MDQ0208341.1 competence protein ComGC [Alkalicoccobacillus murimartini]
MTNLNSRVTQINQLNEKDAKAILKVVFSQLEIYKKDKDRFTLDRFLDDVGELLDEFKLG